MGLKDLFLKKEPEWKKKMRERARADAEYAYEKEHSKKLREEYARKGRKDAKKEVRQGGFGKRTLHGISGALGRMATATERNMKGVHFDNTRPRKYKGKKRKKIKKKSKRRIKPYNDKGDYFTADDMYDVIGF